MKLYVSALTVFAMLATSHAQSCNGAKSAGTVVSPVVNAAAPQDPPPSAPAASSTDGPFPLPSNYPGQNTGVGRGPTGKCLYGRTYCGWSIRDLHTYEDLKAVYCDSDLCPFEDCGDGKVCNPTEEQVFQAVYECDDLVANYEGTSVFFSGACAGSAGWVCANPEPHCTTPRRARLLARSLEQ